jgi:CheY-like chemotaxis protein
MAYYSAFSASGDAMTENRAILIVEDNPQDEMLILRTLKNINIENKIDIVRDGQQALDYLFCDGVFSGRNPELPALVLLDTELPMISGIDVLQKIRSDPRTKSQPVAIMTSTQEEHEQMKGLQGGANILVRKPLDLPKLSKTVARLGVYWVATNPAQQG